MPPRWRRYGIPLGCPVAKSPSILILDLGDIRRAIACYEKALSHAIGYEKQRLTVVREIGSRHDKGEALITLSGD